MIRQSVAASSLHSFVPASRAFKPIVPGVDFSTLSLCLLYFSFRRWNFKHVSSTAQLFACPILFWYLTSVPYKALHSSTCFTISPTTSPAETLQLQALAYDSLLRIQIGLQNCLNGPTQQKQTSDPGKGLKHFPPPLQLSPSDPFS